jgi:hypothetical protein
MDNVKVYGIDLNRVSNELEMMLLDCYLDLSDNEWIAISEQQGLVYTLIGYTHGHNLGDLPDSMQIRFIKTN